MTIIYCKENGICIHNSFCSISTVREKYYLCPCLNCLVKSMCKILCQEREDLFHSNIMDLKKFKEEYNHENYSNL
jgi:hypothetical protein